ncbi:MAG: heavy-metal-associated domain-containing protein [Burkholderiales bacterium]|nr:heavy-metal-associated domain-containing protein [Burkholderiales bacterium]
METLTLNIKGMTCVGCVNSVKRVLAPIAGVANVGVVLETGKVDIGFDASQAKPDQFREAIRHAGYEVLN